MGVPIKGIRTPIQEKIPALPPTLGEVTEGDTQGTGRVPTDVRPAAPGPRTSHPPEAETGLCGDTAPGGVAL